MKIPFGKVILTLVMVSMMVFGSIGTAQASEPLYYYDKYSIEKYDFSYTTSTEHECGITHGVLYRDYRFDRDKGLFYVMNKANSNAMGDRVYNGSELGSRYMTRYDITGYNKYGTCFDITEYSVTYKERKGSYIETITGSINQYPSNGIYYTDGYWYVRKGLVNNNPIIDITTPSGNDYFGKEKPINVSGTVKDLDVGDTLSIKYTINGISAHTNKILRTITANGSNQSFNNNISIDTSISEGTHILNLWVEDDRGGKSNEISRTIKIDKTSPTMKIIVGK